MNNTSNDTICAIATASGGAIGIIRISGNEAISITDRVFMPTAKGGKALRERGANTVAFGRIVSSEGEIIDEVLVSLFRASHSYTGEDSVEISCHGFPRLTSFNIKHNKKIIKPTSTFLAENA